MRRFERKKALRLDMDWTQSLVSTGTYCFQSVRGVGLLVAPHKTRSMRFLCCMSSYYANACVLCDTSSVYLVCNTLSAMVRGSHVEATAVFPVIRPLLDTPGNSVRRRLPEGLAVLRIGHRK